MSENKIEYEGKTITASEYYYGCKPDTWDDMLYPDAIEDRKNRAWELFKQLFIEREQLPYNQDLSEEKALRLRKVRKAYEDNKRLTEEKHLII